MIFNPEHVCPECGGPKTYADAKVCGSCRPNPPITKGRPKKYTDEDILTSIEVGNSTTDNIMSDLEMKSKSNLMKRLRVMRDEGLVSIIERARREGYTITSEREAKV